LGVWRLVECKSKLSDTGEVVDLMGPSPTGYLAFLPDGRMFAILADTQRTADDEASKLFAGMTAYTGRYTVDGDSFTTDVDVSWHPGWLGTKQVRYFELVDDELRITSAEQKYPATGDRLGRGILVWRRER
jgi:hypothetical protein